MAEEADFVRVPIHNTFLLCLSTAVASPVKRLLVTYWKPGKSTEVIDIRQVCFGEGSSED